jgi:dihydrofolate reductase
MKVFIIAAMTADGYIAKFENQLADWTSPEDKKWFMSMTKRAGVMIMGNTTFKTMGKALPGRKTIVYTRTPADSDEVEYTADDPTTVLQRLESEGYDEVAICGGQGIYDLFLSRGLVDELYLTVEPIVFGAGISLFKTDMTVRLDLLESQNLNDDTLLLHYGVKK